MPLYIIGVGESRSELRTKPRMEQQKKLNMKLKIEQKIEPTIRQISREKVSKWKVYKTLTRFVNEIKRGSQNTREDWPDFTTREVNQDFTFLPQKGIFPLN